MRLVAVVLLAAACGPLTPFYVSHATAPHDGREWHSCAGGGECPEGYACVKDGCEWCGDDESETRCTNGND